MSMRGAIASALHLFVLFFFFIAGLFFVLLPQLPLTRLEIVDILSHRPDVCTQVGIGIFIATALFFFGFYSLNRGKYLVIRMGVSSDLRLIRDAVEECLAKHFPQKIALKEVGIGPKSRLDFKVHLVPVNEVMRQEIFVELEQQLGILLCERFGYNKPFHLIVNAP